MTSPAPLVPFPPWVRTSPADRALDVVELARLWLEWQRRLRLRVEVAALDDEDGRPVELFYRQEPGDLTAAELAVLNELQRYVDREPRHRPQWAEHAAVDRMRARHRARFGRPMPYFVRAWLSRRVHLWPRDPAARLVRGLRRCGLGLAQVGELLDLVLLDGIADAVERERWRRRRPG